MSSPPATTRALKIRAAILAEIEPGLQATGIQYTVEVDRAAAIRIALEAAHPGDVVLLAGKGHEKEQILADRTILSTTPKLHFPSCANWAMVEGNESDTGGSGDGRGRVLEAPSSLENAGALVATGYSIDSRTVAPGELFFAVRGERLDGHDFVAGAFERGAVAAVVSRARVASLPDAALAHPLLITEDPLLALQSLAAHVRRQWGRGSSPLPARRERPPPKKPWPRRWAQSSTCSSRRAI